jgi:hypothetical protein
MAQGRQADLMERRVIEARGETLLTLPSRASSRGRVHWGRIGCTIGWLAWAGAVVAQEPLGSVNTDRLRHFQRAVEEQRGPVTVVAFGDSLQATYRSLPKVLFPKLAEWLGQSGRAFDGQYPPVSIPVLLEGARVTSPWSGDGLGTNWFMEHFVLPPGSALFWTNRGYPNGGSMPADCVGLYYIAWPLGGEFLLSTSTEGGPWTPQLRVPAQAEAPEGRFTNLWLAPAGYRIRVDGWTGTNLILWQELVLSRIPGLKTAWLQRDGLHLRAVLRTPAAVRVPILRHLQPHLVLWHMKELVDYENLVGPAAAEAALREDLEQLELWWQAAMPGGDVVYVGTPYEGRDEWGHPVTERQNRIVRDLALRHERTYVDAMTPMVSYSWMRERGYLIDALHLSDAGYAFLAERIWRELGWYALRLDRRVRIEPQPAGARLSWTTRTNLVWDLLASTNLFHWEVVESARGGNETVTRPTPSFEGPVRFFRLQWRPD